MKPPAKCARRFYHQYAYSTTGKGRKKPRCSRGLIFCVRLLGFGGLSFGFDSLGFFKFFVELVNAAVRLNEALLARVERVAVRAGIDLDFFHGRASLEGGSAADAGHGALVVLRMDVFLHVLYSFRLAGYAAKRVTVVILRATLRGCNDFNRQNKRFSAFG